MELCESRHLLTTFTVTSSVDTGPSVPGELRWAIDQANSTPGPDTIEFQDITQVTLSLGELGITDDVDINGTMVEPVQLRILAASNSRVFNVDDNNVLSSINVSVRNLEISGGDVSGFGGAIINQESLDVVRVGISDNASSAGGGGIANFGTLSVSNSSLTENRAGTDGGGGVYSALGDVTLNNVRVRNNQIDEGQGGGIFNAGGNMRILSANISENVANQIGAGVATDLSGSTRIFDSNIESNIAGDIAGGISVGTNSTLRVNGSSIVGNGAQFAGGVGIGTNSTASMTDTVVASNVSTVAGGGIFADSSTLTLDSVEVENNQSGSIVGDGQGAGIMLTTGARVTINKSAIVNNGVSFADATTQAGGGIFVGQAVDLDITDTRIVGNTASTGGGIYTDETSLDNPAVAPASINISDSSISQNVALDEGGGAFISSIVEVSLKCVTISGNSARNGGGLFLAGAVGGVGMSADIRDSTISNNEALENGGGILSLGTVELGISNSIVSGNAAGGNGGGLHLSESPATVPQSNTTRIDLSLISGNSAVGADGNLTTHRGGGIWVGAGAALGVDRTTIDSNSARVRGGGIDAASAELVVISNSTISGNSSLSGGGVAIENSVVDLFQSTVYGNLASRNGGGISIRSSLPESVTVRHSTISRNLAAQGSVVGTGGGIFVTGEADGVVLLGLDHAIISGNSANPSGSDEIHDEAAIAGFTSINSSFSLLSDNSGTLLPGGNPDPGGNIIGTPGAPISAELGPLSDNGGPTLTMVPMDNSPAVDSGSPLGSTLPNFDQRRLPYKRIFNSRIDMGSVEVQPPPPTPDFDGDGRATCDDVDELTAVIVAGTNDPAFDLTGDGLVTRNDLTKWLDDAPDVNGLAITRYLPGDANLDTVVDISDFNIWNANKFTPSSAWCAGNFNADQVVDTSDFNIWNANKFSASPPVTNCGLFSDGSGSLAFAPMDDSVDTTLDQVFDEIAMNAQDNATVGLEWNVTGRRNSVDSLDDDGQTLIEKAFQAVFAQWDGILA